MVGEGSKMPPGPFGGSQVSQGYKDRFQLGVQGWVELHILCRTTTLSKMQNYSITTKISLIPSLYNHSPYP